MFGIVPKVTHCSESKSLGKPSNPKIYPGSTAEGLVQTRAGWHISYGTSGTCQKYSAHAQYLIKIDQNLSPNFLLFKKEEGKRQKSILQLNSKIKYD